jgi:hypothetical protein
LGTLLQVGSFGLPRPQLTMLAEIQFSWLLQVLWFRGGKASSIDTAESVEMCWDCVTSFVGKMDKWRMDDVGVCRVETWEGLCLLLWKGQRWCISPGAWVSSISMICSTAHWRQSSTKWTRLSLQSVSGSILPMVFGQRALDLDNLGHTWTIFDLHVGRICNACSPSFCMFFSTVKLRAFCKKGQGCLVRPDRFVFPFPEKSRFVDSPDMSRYGTIGRYVCFYVIIPAFLRLGAACMRISRCSEWAAVKARPDEVVPRNLLMIMNHMNIIYYI